jgi:hypothetical protein
MFRPRPVDLKPRQPLKHRPPAGEWRYHTSQRIEAHEFWHFLFSLAPESRIVDSTPTKV